MPSPCLLASTAKNEGRDHKENGVAQLGRLSQI